ncbi:hypothetical protein [Polaromonas sp. A23]|uniref:hypothetical protein n=1 Tax=Polaromonas sp. A23 TaxID=1944133 RepID=UPI000984B553|nr:hypothetical protein [Polaromonas sp. A23]OOG48419.1 hypothetical protein B0B52_00295 [Polaromonas sp. A23]
MSLTSTTLFGRGLLLATVAFLSACAATGNDSGAARYRCEHGIDFSVRFVDDSALIESSRGSDVLFRDAGGQGASQPVYSNARLRAEFGLGSGGREAMLRYPLLPLVARCVRD